MIVSPLLTVESPVAGGVGDSAVFINGDSIAVMIYIPSLMRTRQLVEQIAVSDIHALVGGNGVETFDSIIGVFVEGKVAESDGLHAVALEGHCIVVVLLGGEGGARGGNYLDVELGEGGYGQIDVELGVIVDAHTVAAVEFDGSTVVAGSTFGFDAFVVVLLTYAEVAGDILVGGDDDFFNHDVGLLEGELQHAAKVVKLQVVAGAIGVHGESDQMLGGIVGLGVGEGDALAVEGGGVGGNEGAASQFFAALGYGERGAGARGVDLNDVVVVGQTSFVLDADLVVLAPDDLVLIVHGSLAMVGGERCGEDVAAPVAGGFPSMIASSYFFFLAGGGS